MSTKRTRAPRSRASSTSRSRRRAPLSGPTAPSTATVGTSSSGRSTALRAPARGAAGAGAPCGTTSTRASGQ